MSILIRHGRLGKREFHASGRTRATRIACPSLLLRGRIEEILRFTRNKYRDHSYLNTRSRGDLCLTTPSHPLAGLQVDQAPLLLPGVPWWQTAGCELHPVWRP